MMGKQASERNYSLDYLKTIAVAFVDILHVNGCR